MTATTGPSGWRVLEELLRSGFRRALSRSFPALLLLAYLAIVLAISFPVTIWVPGGGPRLLFHCLAVLHVGVAILLPSFLAGALIEDAASGSLELLQVAGVSAGQWITCRLVLMLSDFLPVWVLRWPFYMLVVSLGGATAAEVASAELLLAAMTIVAAQVALAISRLSPIRSSGFSSSAVSSLLLLVAPLLPTPMVQFIRSVLGWPVPYWLSETAATVFQLSPVLHLFKPVVSLSADSWALLAAALHLCLGWLFTWRLRRAMFDEVATPVPSLPGLKTATSGATSRPSERVWDDAFAWQAARLYCPPSPLFVRLLALVGLVVFGWMIFRVPTRNSFGIGFWLVFAMSAPGHVPSICVGHERRRNTIAALGVLPLGGRAIYEGWRRGSGPRKRESWIPSAICLAMMLWQSVPNAIGWLAVAVLAYYAFPPITFCEGLDVRPLTLRKGALFAILTVAIGTMIALFDLMVAGLITTVVACFFRPRALRLMDERFADVSAL